MTGAWRTLAKIVCSGRFAIWLTAGIVAVVAAFGIPRIEFDTRQDTLVPADSKLYRDNVAYQAQFGGDEIVVIFDGDPLQLLQGENLKKLEALHDQLAKSPHFVRTVSPDTLLKAAEQEIPRQVQQGIAEVQALQKKAADDARAAALAAGKSAADAAAAADVAGGAAVQKYVADHAEEAKQFQAIGQLDRHNPAFVKFVLFDPSGKLRPEIAGLVPDPGHALLVATMRGNMSVNDQDAAVIELQKLVIFSGFDGVRPTVAGGTLLLKSIADRLQDSIPQLGLVSVILMVVVVLTAFRARWRLLHLPIVFLAMVIAFGIIGYLDLPLTMASSAGLPILVGLSVDFGIQFHNRYEEELESAGEAGAAMARSLRHIGPALLTALFAAWLGFAALHYSLVPMVRDFSLVLSVGIGVVFLVCLFVLNAILFHRDRHVGGPVRPLGRSRVERTLGRTHDITAGHPFLILAVAAVIAAAGFALDSRIAVEGEPEKFIPPDSQVLDDLEHLSDLTATANVLDFMVSAPDVTDPAVVKWMYDLQQDIVGRDSRVTGANSLATLIAQGAPAGQPPNFAAASAPDFAASVPPDILRGFVSADRKQASIVFTIRRDVPLINQKSIIDEIVKAASPPPGVTAAPAGLGALGIEAESRLTSHRTEMTLLALVAVLVLLLAVTRNVAHAVIAVLPVAMVIGWTSAAMYLLSVPLNPMTSISGPLVVALGTEFSVLLMLRYREECARGAAPAEAMAIAYELSGRAIAASAFTVMGAFIALAFNDFPLLSQFGVVAVMGVLLSLAGAMLLMPPLLVWADETFAAPAPELEEAPSS